MQKILNIIEQMKSSKVANYVIAGLDSYLLENGNVRIFENSRNHQDQITPHSHRFNFTCLVLRGQVTNKIWTECKEENGDLFQESLITYQGEIGSHKKEVAGHLWYQVNEYIYNVGQTYSMTHDQMHSIDFSKYAVVLFFEGPSISNTSLIIEPIVDNRVIRTFENKDYMFIKEVNQ